MSGYKPVGVELLFATFQAATTSVPTAAAVTITAGWPAITVNPGYMSNTGDWSSSLKLKIGGFLTATATVPTWAFGLAYTTTSAFSAATPLATATATVTPTAGSFSWKSEFEIGLRTLGVGAASTIVTHGAVDSNAFSSNLELAPAGSGNTITNWDKNQIYYLWPYLTLSAATAGNTVTLQYGKLYGES